MGWAPRGFYAIVDVAVTRQAFAHGVSDSLAAAGAAVIQLRGGALDTRALIDLASELKPLATRAGAKFLIDGRVDVCRYVGADGVHLGPDDLPVAAAREQLGPDAIIGVSTRTVEACEQVSRTAPCDYVSFGPVFPTSNLAVSPPAVGLEALGRAASVANRPVVAIGGFTLETCTQGLAQGADAVAMIAAILNGDPYRNATEAIERLGGGLS